MPKHTEIDNVLCRGLDGHTGTRERLCAALMANMGGYAAIQPQAPRGGPDGGKDIAARNLLGELSIGAVGFKNGVCDSSDDRRDILAKAHDDLNKAASLGCREFVFFTNVNLTLIQKEKLITCGYSQGVQKIEIVDRERMIAELRRPCNFPTRLDCLDIPMSNEEQAAFFAYLQNEARERVSRVQQDVDLIKTISLLNRPVSNLSVMARFDSSKFAKIGTIAGLSIQMTADVGQQQIHYEVEFIASPEEDTTESLVTAWWNYSSTPVRQLEEPVSFRPEKCGRHHEISRIQPGKQGFRVYRRDDEVIGFLTADFNRSMTWRPRLDVRDMDLAIIIVRGTPELIAALKSATILVGYNEVFQLEPSDYFFENRSSGLSSLTAVEKKEVARHVVMLADKIASLHRVDFSINPPRPNHGSLVAEHLKDVSGGSDLGELAHALGRTPASLAEILLGK